MTINGGIFVLQQVYNKQVSKTWPITAPNIKVPITNLTTINEGDSVVVNVETTDFEGQTLYWTIQGVTGTINSSDFSDISGSFVVQSNNFGTLTITSLADATTEGTESFVIQIRTNSTSGPIKATSGTITINDTSILTLHLYGWFGGGFTPGGSRSTVDRITFASDTIAASVRGPLSSNNYAAAATGSNNFGWFGGGVPGPRSTVERIGFSSDTTATSIRGPLSLARRFLDATGNNNYGWFIAGSPGSFSIIDRIDFAADTGTASVRNPLSSNKYAAAATGNANFGWFGGGIRTPGPGLGSLTSVDRINFAADTSATSARGPLSLRRFALAATGNANFGWFGGGDPLPATGTTSRVDRIDFAADTGTASVRGSLSGGRSFLTATGNANFGWFGGGYVPGTPVLAIVNRITFSSDTVAASSRGALSVARNRLTATSGVI